MFEFHKYQTNLKSISSGFVKLADAKDYASMKKEKEKLEEIIEKTIPLINDLFWFDDGKIKREETALNYNKGLLKLIVEFKQDKLSLPEYLEREKKLASDFHLL